jgi:bacterioferritin
MYVCICRQVTDRDIHDAVAQGACRMRDLRAHDKMVIQFLNKALTVELAGHALYIEAITHCESVKDYVSREILAGIQEDTEDHIDYLETQLELLKKLGEQNHLQSAMGSIVS